MIEKNNILELETRRRIYNFILNNPGLHFRELQRKLNISEGTLKYHLKFLKKRDLITTNKTGRYINFFIKEKIGRKDKQIISLLQKENYRKIILYILFRGCCNRTEISKEIGKHQNTIVFYINKLLKLGVIKEARVQDGLAYIDSREIVGIDRRLVSSEVLYRLTDRYNIIDLLATHKNSLLNYTVVDFLFNWWDFSESKKLPKKINNFEPAIESIYDTIFEIFPHPYYG